MKHASLFSGIGGFDLAAQWMGWENVFQVEIDEFCQKVLAKNFPNVTRYGDIKQFNGTEYRGSVDILTGGFPCQPFSVAGKRKGKEDDRHLWPEMFRVIREVKPQWIVGENVTGFIGLALDQVLSEMESEGYNTETYIIPACGVNAPHRRDRVWIIAYTPGARMRNETGVHNRQTRQSSNLLESTVLQQKHRPTFQQNINASSTPTSYPSLRTGFENFPTQPAICRGNVGIPNRMDRIKSLGNAIVPQVAFEIFKAIESVNESFNK